MFRTAPIFVPGHMPQRRGFGRTGGGSSLLTDLVSYWKLDEASGTRVDSHGSNDLADNNTVTSAAGKINDAALFVSANSEYLSIADNASLSFGDEDFTLTTWIYLGATSGFRALISKEGDAGSPAGQYELRMGDTANRLTWLIRQAGGADCARVTAATFGDLSINTWYHVKADHDAANNLSSISVNGITDSVSTTGTPFDGGGPFNLGAASYLAVDRGFVDGRMDETGLWRRMLTGGEATTLYGAGTPPPYSSF